MANPEHRAIFQRGIEEWNQWREANRYVRPDLSHENLKDAIGREGNFSDVDFSGTTLIAAKLESANFGGANLGGVNLSNANLTDASLCRAYLSAAKLEGANLTRADLTLSNLNDVDLTRADLSSAKMGLTVFEPIALTGVVGLESVLHIGRSIISTDTLQRSIAHLPDSFLVAAGVSDSIIAFVKASRRDFYSCFISYCSDDRGFTERLYADLKRSGVRCWIDRQDLKAGDDLRLAFDNTIRRINKLVLILSEHSVRSPWVKREVEHALDEENRRQLAGLKDWRVVLPIRLDEAIFTHEAGWPTDVRRRHIGDFRTWRDHDFYESSFRLLLRDLRRTEDEQPDSK